MFGFLNYRVFYACIDKLNFYVLFSSLEYGYSTGYPGFGGQPAAQSSTPYVNYPQWNAQPNYNNTSSAPYSQPPPSGPPQGKKYYSHDIFV